MPDKPHIEFECVVFFINNVTSWLSALFFFQSPPNELKVPEMPALLAMCIMLPKGKGHLIACLFQLIVLVVNFYSGARNINQLQDRIEKMQDELADLQIRDHDNIDKLREEVKFWKFRATERGFEVHDLKKALKDADYELEEMTKQKEESSRFAL